MVKNGTHVWQTIRSINVTIPAVFASFDIGNALAAEESVARLKVDSITERRISANVLADTPNGREENTLVVGAHLDSVDVGPGINCNGHYAGLRWKPLEALAGLF